MIKQIWNSSILCVLLLLAALAVWNAPAVADDAQVAIIVNPSNSVTGLSLQDLHKIFLGEKSTWPNGKHIFLIMAAPGSDERSMVLKSVYKMGENDYTKYFLQASFTGAISAPPKDASSAAQVKQLVAENPGAIGYVKQSDVSDAVKVVFKLP
jgi:ABC-type phosphate transport system substrate-binding protein